MTRHFDHVIDVNVVLSVDKLQQKVEANVHVRGKDIHAESVEPDMYAAIDALADKLDRQVVKHKEKLTDHRGDATAIKRARQPQATRLRITRSAWRRAGVQFGAARKRVERFVAPTSRLSASGACRLRTHGYSFHEWSCRPHRRASGALLP